MKRWIVCNHETGVFEICFTREEAQTTVFLFHTAGADLENITVVMGKELEIKKVEKISYEYRIKD